MANPSKVQRYVAAARKLRELRTKSATVTVMTNDAKPETDPISEAMQASMAAAEEFATQGPQWAAAIGGFLATFASCELWVRVFIETFGSRGVAEAVDGTAIATRCKLAAALVRDLNLIESAQTRSDAVFVRVEELSRFRNLVAHNPPRWYVTSGDPLPATHFQIRSARDPARRAGIEDILVYRDRAAALTHELALLFGEVGRVENRRSAGGRAAGIASTPC